MTFKDKLKVLILGPRACNESYIKYLRHRGVIVGDDVVIFRPYNTNIDVQNPHLLTIGNHVMITGPVTILTHDYSWSVIKKKYGYITGNQRKTNIGSNIFIGWGATILAGSNIGDNTIIGANSVVSGHLEGDAVYAGNPAKYIMSIDDYFEKRKKRQLKEAVEYVQEYKSRYGCLPPEEELDEYFYLFKTERPLNPAFEKKIRLLGNEDESLKLLREHTPAFKSYQIFLKYCESIFDGKLRK